MKCQGLFSRKTDKKNIIKLSSPKFTNSMERVKWLTGTEFCAKR